MADVPYEHVHLFTQFVPTSVYPELQLLHLCAPFDGQAAPVVGVPPGHIHLLSEQDDAPARLCFPAVHRVHLTP